jgi:hypothetical protein
VKQLTFVAPGKLEWQEVAPPTLEGDGEAGDGREIAPMDP